MNTKILAAAGLAVAAATASADIAITTFAYSDLDTSYFTADGETGLFTARAGADSSGDVTAFVNGAQTAEYDNAFATDDSSLADVVFEMNISNITGNSADAAGSFMITDLDGDTISGSLAGAWSRVSAGAPVLFFNGTLADVVYTAGGDGVFEGLGGSGFALTPFLLGGSFSGGLVQVSFGVESFFDESFELSGSQFSGTIVPTPGAAALLLGAGGLVARRRR
jgi:hypothetical protein